MTPEEREARRKQFEERMKNMTPEERAAMQQRGGGRGGFQRGGDTAAAGQGGRGSYTLFDTDKKEFEFKRVDYDIKASAEKIFSADLEPNFGHRLFIGV